MGMDRVILKEVEPEFYTITVTALQHSLLERGALADYNQKTIAREAVAE